MKDRKPYQLKGPLLFYNIFQVAFSGYAVFLVSFNSISRKYSNYNQVKEVEQKIKNPKINARLLYLDCI